ncbi:hypothetical protein EOM82_09105 [bacterium]|nr:hypothetical protein [bacterium]
MKKQESTKARRAKPSAKRKAKETKLSKEEEAAKAKKIENFIEVTEKDYNNSDNLLTTIKGERLAAEQATSKLKYYKANGVGRPRRLVQADIISDRIDNYFNLCTETKHAPTKSGLAYALGLLSTCEIDDAILRAKEQRLPEKPTDRQIERFYSDRLISLEIKRAMLRIEDYLQNALLTNGKSVGAIFTLKNHYGYKDVQDINSNIKSQGVVVSIAYGVPEPAKTNK